MESFLGERSSVDQFVLRRLVGLPGICLLSDNGIGVSIECLMCFL